MDSIVELAKSAQASAAVISENEKQSSTLLAEAQIRLAEVTSVATQVIATKTQITDEQAVIATKSDHIQKAQEHADKVRGDLDRTLTAAKQQATEVEGLKSPIAGALVWLALHASRESALAKRLERRLWI